MQEPSQRISLRTPRTPHRESTPHIHSSHSGHDTKVTMGRNHTHSHTYAPTRSHIRTRTYDRRHTTTQQCQRATHLHAFTEDIYTQQPQAHPQHHFAFRPAFEVFMLTNERCREIDFFAFQGVRKGTGGIMHACTHDGRTYIPAKPEIPRSKPAFIRCAEF